MDAGSVSQFNVLRKCYSKKSKFGMCCNASWPNDVATTICASYMCVCVCVCVCVRARVSVLRSLVKFDSESTIRLTILLPCSG